MQANAPGLYPTIWDLHKRVGQTCKRSSLFYKYISRMSKQFYKSDCKTSNTLILTSVQQPYEYIRIQAQVSSLQLLKSIQLGIVNTNQSVSKQLKSETMIYKTSGKMLELTVKFTKTSDGNILHQILLFGYIYILNIRASLLYVRKLPYEQQLMSSVIFNYFCTQHKIYIVSILK
ncbi:Hypothetical_protein [Hexamita inflata]|uniref:Hypothetical_protein n=1 Tax=Hexamita inflata TaxID=28002 RepID=A0AA86QN35_9EUKA|nr:Hypothetical protein HINF_LOCUS43704 [Hexamita inflata]